MSEIPNLINDLALILIVAGIVTLVFKRVKQPIVLGYIVAGFLVSPHMTYTMSVIDKTSIHTWADIGVMFLLFSLGLDFSFKKILKMGITNCSAQSKLNRKLRKHYSARKALSSTSVTPPSTTLPAVMSAVFSQENNWPSQTARFGK